jgi:glycosyltransferase involved in cell wall biosynthesis
VIPSKIFEQAALKKPILLGVDWEARKIIEKYNVGLYFEPENREQFIDALLKLKNDKELYNKLSNNCLELANDFDRKKLAKKMYNIIKKLVWFPNSSSIN